MKKLMIFGDSIIKGVTYSGQSYHLCQDHDFDTIAAQGVTVENYARMGATIDAGLKQIDRRLAPCAEDTTVLFCFGGNDCDYDWKAISADPDGEHLPHTPSERFIDGYCTAIRKARQNVEMGKGLAESMAQSPYFPKLLTEMTGVGEQSGNMEKTLTVVGDYFNNEVSLATERLLSVLEPCITIGLAIVTVLLLLGVYLPMFTMYGSIV